MEAEAERLTEWGERNERLAVEEGTKRAELEADNQRLIHALEMGAGKVFERAEQAEAELETVLGEKVECGRTIAALEAELAALKRTTATCMTIIEEKNAELAALKAINQPLLDQNELLKAELAALREGIIRIIQCHNYPLVIEAIDVATGEQGPHTVDGYNCSDVLAVIHEVLLEAKFVQMSVTPDFGGWAAREETP